MAHVRLCSTANLVVAARAKKSEYYRGCLCLAYMLNSTSPARVGRRWPAAQRGGIEQLRTVVDVRNTGGHCIGQGIESLFGWIAAQIPVQPHKCSAFGLRGVAVRMHWSTAADQPKSYESCLTVVTLIEGCLRKRNSAKQALRRWTRLRGRAGSSGSLFPRASSAIQ